MTSKSNDLVALDGALDTSDESVTPLDYTEIHDTALRHALEHDEQEALTHRQKAAEHVVAFARAIADAHSRLTGPVGQHHASRGTHDGNDTFERWAKRLNMGRRTAERWVKVAEQAAEYLTLAPKLHTDMIDNVSGLALLLGAGPVVQETVLANGTRTRKEIEHLIEQAQRTQDENEHLRAEIASTRESLTASEHAVQLVEEMWDKQRAYLRSEVAAEAEQQYSETIAELKHALLVAQRKVTGLEERWRIARDQLTQRARYDTLATDMARTMDRWKGELPEPSDAGYLTEFESKLTNRVMERCNSLRDHLAKLQDSLSVVEGTIQQIEGR
jgi:hypothetical protein